MNEVTLTKEELKTKYIKAMAIVRDLLTQSQEGDDEIDTILQVGIIGSLIGAKLITLLFEKGEEE